MIEVNPEKVTLDQEMSDRNLDPSPIPLLDKVKKEGRVWEDLCVQYGVENPDPPWKVTLEATCDVLDEVSCGIPGIERRWEEDEFSKDLYSDLPFPERQLLALAHSMIRRGLLDENDLAKKMKLVEKRLNMA
ncbi:MAG: hypothetical protein VX923_06405 [Pseudomonadota bacterium]|nr:hypothetical protein [Pseudomonadota bacterium]